MIILPLYRLLFSVLILFSVIYWQTIASAQVVSLSIEEKQWLKKHPVIRLAHERNYPPFEWQDEKEVYHGLSVDYIKLLQKRLPIRFEAVNNENWQDILNRFKAGEIDVLPLLARNKLREEFMLFTQKHISVPNVIISSVMSDAARQSQDLLSILQGKKVAVVKGFYWDDYLSRYEDQIRLVRVNDTRTGIELTAMAGVDAMISDMGSVTYIIREDQINNLKIIKTLPQQLQMGMGIRKDWPILQSILDKALASITVDEKEKIQSRWIRLEEIYFWQQPLFWYSVLAAIILVLILFGTLFAWNASLQKQVERRSKELTQLQLQLMHTEKMESIGRLSAGIAHEVKNPLAIIQMGIDFLQSENKQAASEEILNDMADAVARADGVIKGLLDYSREKDLKLKPGNINQVINDSIHLIEHELRLHNIQMELTLTDELPLISMDANKLQQVFINLFMNAIQAMGKQGKITVITELTALSDPRVINNRDGAFRQNQQVIRVTINDTGSGLPEHKAEAVFEPFFTTKAVGKGTGLGLSVSRSIIQLHHGAIYMKNRKTGGVSVKITFPY